MRIKLAISLVLALLVFIFITQNTEVVGVTFLAWSIEISLVVLVFIMLGAGMIIGWLLNSYQRYARKGGQTLSKSQSSSSQNEQNPESKPEISAP